MQDLLRTLRAKKSELDDWTKDLTSDLDGLPLLVKKAEDHAAKLQQEAESQEGWALFCTYVTAARRVDMCVSIFSIRVAEPLFEIDNALTCLKSDRVFLIDL